jgi:tetratricopeptide (TPR) repeat protein
MTLSTPRIMRPPRALWAITLLSLALASLPNSASASTPQADGVRADAGHVRIWNRFADSLYQLHLQQLDDHEVRVETRIGGYPGGMGGAEYYREESYFAEPGGELLSRIQWERHQPHSIHSIQVNLHDAQGRVTADYYAAYLPSFRNAPMRTQVNLHSHDGELRAFRQFDAQGRRLYEQCRGRFQGESLWLEQEYFPVAEEMRNTEAYTRCFGELDEQAGEWLDPLHATQRAQRWPAFVPDSQDALDRLIEQYNEQIPITPLRGDLRVKRGDAYFLKQDFEQAIRDYEAALEIDDALDEAYFGRGMARARLGDVQEGIEDLNVFMERNPGSSLAHTKRGIRYLWLGDAERAEADFRAALRIDPRNAEAHSDLGVMLAQRGDYSQATRHMEAAVENDPSYQKAFHNLAMVHYLEGRTEQALESVDSALTLNPRTRDTVLLKSEILKAMGEDEAALRLQESAGDLPTRDWSERLPLD